MAQDDRRVRIVRIQAKGAALAVEMEKVISAFRAEILRDISDHERISTVETLRRFERKVAARMQKSRLEAKAKARKAAAPSSPIAIAVGSPAPMRSVATPCHAPCRARVPVSARAQT